MWIPDPDDLYSDDLLMQLWWRKSHVARHDIELEINRIVEERGWSDDADSNEDRTTDTHQEDEDG